MTKQLLRNEVVLSSSWVK